MNNLEKFYSYKSHPFYKKMFAKLTFAELEKCEEFIRDNSNLTSEQYQDQLIKFFVDKENKPKNFLIILELLSNLKGEK